MLRQTLHLVLLLALVSCHATRAANILFLSPHTSYSHSHLFHYTTKALASRGHTVTHWNGLAARESVANLTYLSSRRLQSFNQMHDIGFRSNNNIFNLIMSLPERMASVCSVSYNDPGFQHLLNTHEKFDFIVLEAFMNECMLPFVDHFKVPFAYLSPVPPLPWMLDATCSPMSSHQLPVICSEFTDEMNVFQRAANAVMGLFMIYYRRLFILPRVDDLAAKAWSHSNFSAPLRPVKDIEKEVTLFISNTQPTISYQFPTSAAVIHIGGLHIANAPAKPLPDEWESFVSGSGDAGFIVMSFGTIVRGAGMPEATRKIFVSAFSRLSQRVLWKWEDKSGMADLPANVKISPWLPPINDLLSHPKAKLFLSHGGLYSNQEAMWFGVPLIGFPIFGDQTSYINKAVNDGYAMRIDWEYMTEESLYNGIVEMINNPKYKKRVTHLSQVMRDRVDLDQPLERTVRSIEYVIRHKGGLKPAKCRLAIIQRELWDVTFLFALLAILVAYGALRVTQPTRQKMYRLLQRNSVAVDKKDQ